MVYIFKIGWLKTIVPPLVPPYKNQTEVLNENHKLKHPVQVWEGHHSNQALIAYPSLNVAFYSVPRYKISTVRIREYSHGNFS